MTTPSQLLREFQNDPSKEHSFILHSITEDYNLFKIDLENGDLVSKIRERLDNIYDLTVETTEHKSQYNTLVAELTISTKSYIQSIRSNQPK